MKKDRPIARGSIRATIAIGKAAADKVPKTNSRMRNDRGSPIISALTWSCSSSLSKS